MNDIDKQLTDAGTAWRAVQPAPPEPELDRLGARPRGRWPALPTVAVATAVAAVIAGTVFFMSWWTPPDAPTGSPARAAWVPTPPPALKLSGPEEMIVRDGDTVEASGVV